jgi:hypothetical protein
MALVLRTSADVASCTCGRNRDVSARACAETTTGNGQECLFLASSFNDVLFLTHMPVSTGEQKLAERIANWKSCAGQRTRKRGVVV